MTVEITKLLNGMTVVTDNLETLETVSLGIWVRAGPRFETIDNNGVSHLLEHMAFKGTAKRSARDIAEEIENVGGQLNAFTARETTAFHATVLKDNVSTAIDIIGDILQNSVFDQEELEREQAVVLQEIGQALDIPDEIVFDHLQSTAFPGQPLGLSILGFPEVVDSMTRETLISYMEAHYTPQQMIFAAAGNLNMRQSLPWLRPNSIMLYQEKLVRQYLLPIRAVIGEGPATWNKLTLHSVLSQ